MAATDDHKDMADAAAGAEVNDVEEEEEPRREKQRLRLVCTYFTKFIK